MTNPTNEDSPTGRNDECAAAAPMVCLAAARVADRAAGAAMAVAGKPIPPPNIVKRTHRDRYQRRYRLRTFVETGTYTGEMAQGSPARRTGDSIEVAPALHVRHCAGSLRENEPPR
jgi:hypothetical protein